MCRERVAAAGAGRGRWIGIGGAVAWVILGLIAVTPAPARGSGQTAPGCDVGTPAPAPAVAGTAIAGASGRRVMFGETEALLFGAGDYGVVLSHGAVYDAASWRPQAEAVAAAGMVALSLEQTSPGDILAGIRFLRDHCEVQAVALIGASAGGSTALRAASQEPDLIDQLILLSSGGDVSGLGEFPKLFVASEGERVAATARRMADEAPGSENEALILPGDAHAQAIFQTDQGDRLLTAIIERLQQYQ